MKKLGYLLLAVALLGIGIVGCTDFPTAIGVTQGVASNPGVVYGKVIDAQTRQGIANATVYLKIDGTWVQTTTQSATTGGAESLAGNFTMRNVPVSTTIATIIPVVIKAPQGTSYLTLKTAAAMPVSPPIIGVNQEVPLDMGLLEMEKGLTASIFVVDSATGSYVTKSDSGALAVYNGWGGLSVEDELAVRDTTDTNMYTLVIPQTGTTTVTFPAQDTTADGIADYTTATETINPNGPAAIAQSSLIATIVTNKITPNTFLDVVADNIVQVAANGGAAINSLVSGSNIQMLLNMPVEIAYGGDQAVLSYTDRFKTLTTAAVTAEVKLAATLSTNGTILTLTPAAALTGNMDYTVEYRNLAFRKNTGAIAGNDVTLAGLTSVLADGLTIVSSPTGSATIGSSPNVTVDNRNFCTNGAVLVTGDPINCATSVNTLRLVFPERVWGSFQVYSYVVGAGTPTVVNSAPTSFLGQATPDTNISGMGYFVTLASTVTVSTGNHAGLARTGSLYTQNLNLGAYADSTTATPVKVTVGIDAYDAEGNIYRIPSQTFDVL